jgi:hypothetical protein
LTMTDLDETRRLQRMRHHNATTSPQRQEVIRSLADALTDSWDGDCAWQTLGEFLGQWLGDDMAAMKDTEIVGAVASAPFSGAGEPGAWDTFPEMTKEWRAELRRRALDPEQRHTVDVNELRVLGVIGEDE